MLSGGVKNCAVPQADALGEREFKSLYSGSHPSGNIGSVPLAHLLGEQVLAWLWAFWGT